MSFNEQSSGSKNEESVAQRADDTAASGTRSISDQQKSEALRDVNRTRSGMDFVGEWAKIFLVSVLLFVVIRTFFVEAFKIPSGSMENTLQIGDFLLVNKLVYGAEVPFTNKRLPRIRDPQRGDVIVFEYPEDPTKYFVKRLEGVPGDTVEMRDGTLIRNSEIVDERYVEHTEPDFDPTPEDFRWQRDYLVKTAVAAGTAYRPSRNTWGPLVVPKGNYLALGDNRDNSYDSRYWGWVADSLIKGQPFVIYYSYAPDSSEHSLAWLTHIRWSRLGERIR
jgi:signal peptidase I